MTEEEALVLFAQKVLPVRHDAEAAHWEADRVLVKVLESLGYSDLVRVWREVHKWYV